MRLRKKPAVLAQLMPPPGLGRRYLALSVIDALGTGMFIPVTVIFLARVVRLPVLQIGIGLTVAGVVALLATPFVGQLGDRHDARHVAFAGYAVLAVGFCLYPWIDSFASFVALAVAIQTAERVASSSRTLVALSIATGSERLRLIAYERAARNLGYGLGALCASLALLHPTRLGFAVVLIANAGSYAIGGLILIGMPSARVNRGDDAPPIRFSTVLRDRPYVLLAFLTGVMWLIDSILRVGLPLWIIERMSLAPAFNGLFFALNTALIAALQLRVSRMARDAEGASWAFRRAALSGVACCGLFALAPVVPTTVALGVLALAVIALTLGETLISAAQWATSIGLLREELRGRYLAVTTTFIAAESAVGPSLMTFALVRGGDWGWLGLGCLFVATGGAASRVTLSTAARYRQAANQHEVSLANDESHVAPDCNSPLTAG